MFAMDAAEALIALLLVAALFWAGYNWTHPGGVRARK
jgi:hypothetical protein